MPEQNHKFNGGSPEILSPKIDVVFKKIFLENEDLLAAMIKPVLNLPDEEFDEIKVECQELLPEQADGKGGVLDIKITTKSGMVINLEMQCKNIGQLRERIVFYFSGLIREQLVKGDDYDKIKRVICIVVTDRSLIPDDNNYHHRFALYDMNTGAVLTNLIEVNTLELSKLPDTDDGSDLWSWMKFLTIETREDLSMIAEKSPELKKAADRLLEVSISSSIRQQYEWCRLAEMDERVMRREAIAEGKAEGRAEGRAEGKAEGRAEGRAEGKAEGEAQGMAKVFALLEKGYSIEDAKKTLQPA